MAGQILATVTPDNSPGGSILTFAFPMALFIVAAVVLYLTFTRPHQVPGHKKLAAARASSGTPGTPRPAPPGRQAPGGGTAKTAAAAGGGSSGAGTGSSAGKGGSAVGGDSAAPAEGSKADD